MSYYNELTTVNDVRSAYLSITGSGDDNLMRDLIRAVSMDIERAAQRSFVPRIQTRYYDYLRDVEGAALWLDADLLAVTTLTNGDSATIASNKYTFEPRNATPYFGLRLLNSGGVYWTYSTDNENAVTVLGVWGYHTDYANAWQDTGATLAAAISSTSATTFSCTTGLIKAGMLLKIDSEYFYVSSVSVSSSDTVTCVRGANGSTAATHLISTALSVWTPQADVVQLAREASAARYRLRENPLAESFVMLDGTTVSTPKDVSAYIEKRVAAMGLVRGRG